MVYVAEFPHCFKFYISQSTEYISDSEGSIHYKPNIREQSAHATKEQSVSNR